MLLQMTSFYSFLMDDLSIYLYVYRDSYRYRCHIFFMLSSADGLLSCFRVLTVVNNAVVNRWCSSFGFTDFVSTEKGNCCFVW